ncbi:MAG: DUF5050 domain-containing protein [Clostridiaceae bacterium]
MKRKSVMLIFAACLIIVIIFGISALMGSGVDEAYGNIRNGGFVTEDSGWLYYNKMEGDTMSLYKSRENGANGSVIVSEAGAPISISDGWIYYSKFGVDDSDPEIGRLIRVRTNGKERTVLTEEKAYNAVIDKGFAYYNEIQGTNVKLIALELETKVKTVLSEGTSFEFILLDQWIYYLDLSDGIGSLARISTDGKNKEKLNEERTVTFSIDGGNIYYVIDETPYTEGESGVTTDEGVVPVFKVYRMKVDGTEKGTVTEASPESFNVYKGWIYYQDSMDGMIYRVKTDGMAKKMIRDKSLLNIMIVGDWIYFYDNQEPNSTSPYRRNLGSLYRMKLDGTGEVLFE